MSNDALAKLQKVWEAQAAADPFWAVLSEDGKRRRGWDPDEFFGTGMQFVEKVMKRFEAMGKPIGGGEGLDFGCGLGRLTQALACYFDKVVGVDISRTMVEGASRLNTKGDAVKYVVNVADDLTLFKDSSFDFIMCFIVLQHVPPEFARTYLTEFMRLLRPSGKLFFQLPSHPNPLLRYAGGDAMPMAPERAVAGLAFLQGVRTRAESRQTFEVIVEIQNRSVGDWISTPRNPIRIGNHWELLDGTRVINDDGRSQIPALVPKGATCVAKLQVTAPEKPGRYKLIIDMVQEGVLWFADVGSQTLEAEINVTAPEVIRAAQSGPEMNGGWDRLADLVAADWFEPPSFEMNAIPKAEVEQLIDSSGGKLLAYEEHEDDWVSYSYYVERV
jgi:SAM-dependent methyltransferase